jgi:hypothetical protein
MSDADADAAEGNNNGNDDRMAVLRGTLDSSHELSALRANALVWSRIFEMSDAMYSRHLNVSDKAFLTKPTLQWRWQWGSTAVAFPEPTGIKVNMLPFDYWDIKGTLPDYLAGYKDLIWQCPVLAQPSEGGVLKKIVYLSVHESLVRAGETHRRPGLHIERPACVSARVIPHDTTYGSEYHSACWGLGFSDENGHPVDGIYMASNVDDSCEVWPALIDDPAEVTDDHGSVEHMRSYMLRSGVRPIKLKANSLTWITDRTPHESLPIKSSVYRQWFRLVVGPISVWHSKHNSWNPLGVQPDAPISDVDRFA